MDSVKINLTHRINIAWASALQDISGFSRGLVHFSPTHLIFNTHGYQVDCANVFRSMGYLAKSYSKVYGLGIKNFTSSRIPTPQGRVGL